LIRESPHRVCNVDKLTYAGHPESVEEAASDPRYRLVRADVADPGAMEAAVAACRPDAVVHLAAESHVDRSIRRPESFIHTNILGTFQLLERAKARGAAFRLFHHVSTDEVYGSLGPTGLFTEDMPYRPNSPYSASKAASDHLVRAYSETFGLPATISNCSNNYGPYQFPEKLIPLMVLNGLEGKALPVYGDGRNVRDWLYVEDHCEAIWLIMREGKRGETYNIGGNAEMENIAIVHLICALLDELAPSESGESRERLITYVADRPGHDRRYALNVDKIKALLGWRPRQSFAEGLRKTVAWYLANRPWIEGIRTGAYRSWIEEHYGKEA
jgi:dTDP-glucose 4,6-dehydratase